jgi:tight adherence protein C
LSSVIYNPILDRHEQADLAQTNSGPNGLEFSGSSPHSSVIRHHCHCYHLGGFRVDSDTTIMIFAVAMAVSLAMLGGLFFTGRSKKLEDRIDSLTGKDDAEKKPESVRQMARQALPKMGKIMVPEDEAERTKLRARLVHAGLYHRQAMYIFLGVKLFLLSLATLVGVVLTMTNVLPVGKALPLSLIMFFMGMIGPSFWLDSKKKERQTILRRGLPDALDVLIICQEGGLSLQAGLKRVADELKSAHPVLSSELKIVDREIQLGRSPGEALHHFGQRSDLEEAISLASVVGQSERFGASLVKSLRSHSESLRIKRRQKAEEKAQKASTKILIPTLLFIFPAVFVILLAPAAYQVMSMFAETK